MKPNSIPLTNNELVIAFLHAIGSSVKVVMNNTHPKLTALETMDILHGLKEKLGAPNLTPKAIGDRLKALDIFQVKPFSPKELAVAQALVDGHPHRLLPGLLGITPSALGVYLRGIKKKALIPHPTPQNLVDYLNTPRRQSVRPLVSPHQHRVLALRATGWSFKGISRALNLTESTVANVCSQACARLGITSTGKQRMEDISKALRGFYPPLDSGKPEEEITIENL